MQDPRILNMLIDQGNLIIQLSQQIARLTETIDSLNEIYSHREYTVKEAAQILNRSDSTIHRWIKEGSMPNTPKADGSIVITKLNIDQYHGRTL